MDWLIGGVQSPINQSVVASDKIAGSDFGRT